MHLSFLIVRRAATRALSLLDPPELVRERAALAARGREASGGMRVGPSARMDHGS